MKMLRSKYVVRVYTKSDDSLVADFVYFTGQLMLLEKALDSLDRATIVDFYYEVEVTRVPL